EAGAPEVQVRVHATGRVLLAVVHDGAVERSSAAQKIVEIARAHGVAWREPEGDARLDRLRDVESEVAQTQARAMDLVFGDLEIAGGKADSPLNGHVPASVRLGRRW